MTVESQVRRLTKADIVQGRRRVEEAHIEALEGTVRIRPLTDGEWAEVEATRARGIRVGVSDLRDRQAAEATASLDLDLETVARAEYEANALAAAYGLSVDEAWTVEDVKGISPPSAVAEIAQKVYELSGVTPERVQEVQAFRRQRRR